MSAGQAPPSTGCAQALKTRIKKTLGALGGSLLITSAVFFLAFLTHWGLYGSASRPQGDVEADLSRFDRNRKLGDKVSEKVSDDVWTRDDL